MIQRQESAGGAPALLSDLMNALEPRCLLDGQIIDASVTPAAVAAGDTFTVTVAYMTDPAATGLPGLNLNLHFDSTQLTLVNSAATLTDDLLFPEGVTLSDAQDADNAPATDLMLRLVWDSAVGESRSFPSAFSPDGSVELFTATFLALPGFTGGAMNFTRTENPGSAPVDFEASSLSIGAKPRVSVTATTDQSSEAGSAGVLRFTRDLVSEGDLVVPFAINAAGGDHLAGVDDFQAGLTAGFVTIPGNLAFVDLTLLPVDDALVEGDETLSLTIEASEAFAVDAEAATASVQVADNDFPVASVSDLIVNENDSVAAFVITLTEPFNAPITISYATVDGSAIAGDDYVANVGEVTIPAGMTMSSPITVSLVDDDLSEGDETFSITLSNAMNAILGDEQADALIIDNDAPVITLTTIDAQASETPASNDPAVFRFTRSSLGDDLIVRFRLLTFDTTQAGADDLQEIITDQVLIPAGELFVDLTLTPADDAIVEGAELLQLELILPPDEDSYFIGDPAVADAIILDNDLPTISIADASAFESAGLLTFAVTLSAPTNDVITVNYATAADSATSDEDFTPTSGQLTFLPGETTQTITVDVLDEDFFEADETLAVNLSSPVGAALDDAAGLGVILDDDPLPTVSVVALGVPDGDGSVAEGAAGGVTFTRDDVDLDDALTVRFQLLTGPEFATAEDVQETIVGEITFPPNESSLTLMFTAVDDALLEGDERFGVKLLPDDDQSYLISLGDPIQNSFIIRDSELPAVTIADIAVDESAGVASFNVSLSQPIVNDIIVSYFTTPDTAAEVLDFQPAVGEVTIPAGAVSPAMNIEIQIVDDELVEGDEQFDLAFIYTFANRPSIVGEPAAAVIVDNDGPTNDSQTNAAALPSKGTLNAGAATASNEHAGADEGEPNHAGLPAARTLWWTWTPAASGAATFSTAGSNFDTVIAIYTLIDGQLVLAGSDGDGESQPQDNNTGPGDTSNAWLHVDSNQTYFVAVGSGSEATSGDIALDVFFGRELAIESEQTVSIHTVRSGKQNLKTEVRLDDGLGYVRVSGRNITANASTGKLTGRFLGIEEVGVTEGTRAATTLSITKLGGNKKAKPTVNRIDAQAPIHALLASKVSLREVATFAGGIDQIALGKVGTGANDVSIRIGGSQDVNEIRFDGRVRNLLIRSTADTRLVTATDGYVQTPYHVGQTHQIIVPNPELTMLDLNNTNAALDPERLSID